MDKRTPVQGHIFQHLFEYVELHPVIKDGRVFQVADWTGLVPMYNREWSFYVDNNGFLRKPKEKVPPWNKNEDNPNLIRTKNPSLFYIKRESDGVWFSAKLKDPPSCGASPQYFSLFVKERNPAWAEDILGSHKTSGKKIVLKTLSKKEKKKLKL